MIVIRIVKSKLGELGAPEEEVASVYVTNNHLGTKWRGRYDVECEGPVAPLDAPDSIRGFLRTELDALDLAAIALRVVARWRDSPINLDDQHRWGDASARTRRKYSDRSPRVRSDAR